MKQPTVSVVVPNWNGKDILGKCLDSLQTQSYRPAEIIVVENGSIDGSAEYIAKHYPEVALIVEPENLGFAGGVNVGIKAAKSDYIWLFNKRRGGAKRLFGQTSGYSSKEQRRYYLCSYS